MTPEQIEELERLHAAATPGPWTHSETQWVSAEPWSEKLKPGSAMVCVTNGNDPRREANAALIAVMRNALPDLLRVAKSRLADEASAMAAPQAADPAGLGSRTEKSIPHPLPHESPKEG